MYIVAVTKCGILSRKSSAIRVEDYIISISFAPMLNDDSNNINAMSKALFLCKSMHMILPLESNSQGDKTFFVIKIFSNVT